MCRIRLSYEGCVKSRSLYRWSKYSSILVLATVPRSPSPSLTPWYHAEVLFLLRESVWSNKGAHKRKSYLLREYQINGFFLFAHQTFNPVNIIVLYVAHRFSWYVYMRERCWEPTDCTHVASPIITTVLRDVYRQNHQTLLFIVRPFIQRLSAIWQQPCIFLRQLSY